MNMRPGADCRSLGRPVKESWPFVKQCLLLGGVVAPLIGGMLGALIFFLSR